MSPDPLSNGQQTINKDAVKPETYFHKYTNTEYESLADAFNIMVVRNTQGVDVSLKCLCH